MNDICLVFLLLALMSCKQKDEVYLPLLDVPDEQWATFEGRIVSGNDVFEVELSLLESSPGVPSMYRLNGLTANPQYTSAVSCRGQYETTILDNGLFGITLLGKETGALISSGAFFQSQIPKLRRAPMRESELATTDLYFVTSGDGRLTLTDDNFTQIAAGSYSIVKRSSLFTVEGYLSQEADSSFEFFERNTRESWRIAQVGMFDSAKERYSYLAREPWEGIYVRAVAYSVADTARTEGKHNRHLVLKSLIAFGDDAQ